MNSTFSVYEHFLIDSNISTHLISFEENELHNHDFIEFTYVLQGTCEHNFNGTISTIKPGEAFLLVPTDNHQYLKNYSNDFLHRDIIFTYDYFRDFCSAYSETLYDDILKKKYSLHFTMDMNTISNIENIIPNILLNKNPETAEIATKAITFYILNAIINNTLFKQNQSRPEWLTQILFFMHSTESLNVPLNVFLKTIPYSQGYLCHQFKKKMGITMTEYFNNQKISWAKNLLTTTSLSIEKICEKIGFNNLSHFYDLFKKQYGVTPTKIRNTQEDESK